MSLSQPDPGKKLESRKLLSGKQEKSNFHLRSYQIIPSSLLPPGFNSRCPPPPFLTKIDSNNKKSRDDGRNGNMTSGVGARKNFYIGERGAEGLIDS